LRPHLWCVSPISFLEIAIKAKKGLKPFARKHLETLVFDLNLTELPFSAEHALGLLGVPACHHDPFGRALVSIALAERVPPVARGQEFKKYKGLRTIWWMAGGRLVSDSAGIRSTDIDGRSIWGSSSLTSGKNEVGSSLAVGFRSIDGWPTIRDRSASTMRESALSSNKPHESNA
jgi:PIN domain nuclease of toxin-antitoxin system